MVVQDELVPTESRYASSYMSIYYILSTFYRFRDTGNPLLVENLQFSTFFTHPST